MTCKCSCFTTTASDGSDQKAIFMSLMLHLNHFDLRNAEETNGLQPKGRKIQPIWENLILFSCSAEFLEMPFSLKCLRCRSVFTAACDEVYNRVTVKEIPLWIPGLAITAPEQRKLWSVLCMTLLTVFTLLCFCKNNKKIIMSSFTMQSHSCCFG